MKISNETHNKILSEIKHRLMPDLKKVLLKVFAIHIFSTLLTLTVCPQLGYSLIESKVNLMHLFMKVGPHFCDFACGIFFTSVSVGFIYTFLSKDEFRFLRFHPVLLVSTILLSSLGFLMMLNPNMFVQLTLLWVFGAIIGILGTMEISFRILRRVF